MSRTILHLLLLRFCPALVLAQSTPPAGTLEYSPLKRTLLRDRVEQVATVARHDR